MTSSGHLLFVGQAVLDHVFDIDRLTADAGKFEARAYRCNPAGLAANAALAAHALRDGRASPTVRLVSAVGDDAVGNVLMQALSDAGLDGRFIARVAGASTPVSSVLVDACGERQVQNRRGTALAMAALPADSLWPGCAGVLTDPRWPAGAASALAAARRFGVVSVLDAEAAPREVLHALVPQADWCVFSLAGLQAWMGHPALAAAESANIQDDASQRVLSDALALVAQTSPQAELVVTLGAQGALWRRPGGSTQHLPAFAVQVVNSNGAGDVMHVGGK